MPNGSYLLAARCITYNVLLFCNKHCKKFLSFSREKSSKVRNNLSICRVALQNRCTRKQTYSPLKAEARQVVSRVRSWVAKSLRLPNLSTKQAYIYFQPRSTTVSCLLGECQTLYQKKEMSRKSSLSLTFSTTNGTEKSCIASNSKNYGMPQLTFLEFL